MNKKNDSAQKKLIWEKPCLMVFENKAKTKGNCFSGSGDSSDCDTGNYAGNSCLSNGFVASYSCGGGLDGGA